MVYRNKVRNKLGADKWKITFNQPSTELSVRNPNFLTNAFTLLCLPYSVHFSCDHVEE